MTYADGLESSAAVPAAFTRCQRIDLPGSHSLSFSDRLQEIRTGFERAFWVANISEKILERLSYYGAFASLALYLQEKLNFSAEQTGTLTGLFGGMVWFLAISAGPLRPPGGSAALSRSPISSSPLRIF